MNVNSANTPVLTDSEKETLLRITRETLVLQLGQGRVPSYDVEDAGLLQATAAFVTLRRKNGNLQGCIGRTDVSDALYRTVQDCAISAATQDYRFVPLSDVSDLDDIVIEISALSPFRRIESPDEIQIGQHGLLIRRKGQTGLLLPQVASERGWDRSEFLRAICTKAGLPSDAWQKADLYVFSAEVFGEE